MRKRVEYIVYLSLYVVFGIVYVRSLPQSDNYLYYTLTVFIAAGILFTLTHYFISPRLQRNKVLIPILLLGIALILSFLASGYFYAAYIRDLFKENGPASISLFQPLILKEILPLLVLPVILGMLHLINFKKQVVRKTARYLGIGVLVLAAAFLVKYVIDVNYKGDDSIHFINEDYHSLNDIIRQDQFKGKVVYIDLWFSSCSPCIREFKMLPALKDQLKNEDIEYLYLARETSHPNSKQLWKNAIRKHKLNGWHVYMTDELEENVWALIGKNTSATPAYPHYLLVNRSNEIISFDAKKPSDQKLVQDLQGLLNNSQFH